ncbi:hypothetical protein BJX66DRAFT_329944 [Aspergillus keveii]|uniref:NACHT domain-containing protein n=1 Tax=Aspergillus keveii TaxID=714993 RepID=A0ABR4FMQ0_9EURO
MADPLSIAAGIVGLATLAEEVFQLVCKFGRQVKDAQNDIKRLSTEIRGLSTVQDVKSRLDKVLGGIQGQQWKAAATRLKWPYTSKEVKKLLEEISAHKKTIGLALTADTMKAMLKALSKQEDLSNEISDVQHTLNDIQTRIVVDKHRQDVLDFFLRHNPQSDFEMSRRLRHPLTGLWLTEGAQFKTWLDSQNGKLWLSGIPGAGKTVLAGSMIEECLKRTWYAGSTKATCFFFCDYKEPKSQDAANILSLSSIPTSSRLLEIIVQMTEEFDQVLMIIDGLDECGSDSTLADDLVSLSKRAPSISMSLLSRVEHHIRVVLEGDFAHIEIAAQNADVQLYTKPREGDYRSIDCRSPGNVSACF